MNEKGSGLRFSFCTQSSQSFSKKRGFPSHPKQGRLHEKVHEMSEWRTGRRYICERYGYGFAFDPFISLSSFFVFIFSFWWIDDSLFAPACQVFLLIFDF